MQQMDVWSRDHADTLDKKKKVELRRGVEKSQGNELRERSAPAAGPFLRRATPWPILGTALPLPLPPRCSQDWGSGRSEENLFPGATGNLRFPIDNTYHGCPLLLLYPQIITGLVKDCSLHTNHNFSYLILEKAP